MNEADFAMLQIKPLFHLSVWDKAPSGLVNGTKTWPPVPIVTEPIGGSISPFPTACAG